MAKLCFKFRSNGIIPLGCSLNTQFAIKAELVGAYQVIVELIGRSCVEAELGIQHILPLEFLPIVIVGKQLQVGKHGVSALTSLVPVVGDIVLGNLQ